MIKNSGYNLRFSLLFGGHLCIIKQRFLERSIERNRNMSASVRSMTGYGRGEHIAEERKFMVEMKSVNHRYNDMTIKLPRSLAGLEDKIKKRIMHEVFRGKTDVYISFETFSAADVEVKLNEALAAAYIEKLKLIEENRLYDMMEAQTARQIAMLRDLLAELQKTEDPDRARHLLGQVIIIGTYIKRRSNLIFVGEQRGAISVQELRLCLNESSENISIYGADCKTVIKGEGWFTVEQATQVYDLFEAVVETELESLRALLISIEVGKWVEVALCVSAAEPLCGLRARFPDLEWEQDEDGLQYVTRKLERSRG